MYAREIGEIDFFFISYNWPVWGIFWTLFLLLLFQAWGTNSYVYAPKDDCKHRAYWREPYTVDEAEHLGSLIYLAAECNIDFYYAISPGLDITYSSPKEVSCLKRKLEQVAQLGCRAFALLFDDIEPEMCKQDKEVFQSFAHAQVSVTNEIFQVRKKAKNNQNLSLGIQFEVYSSAS